MPVTPEESLDGGGPSRAISATTHLEDPSSKAPVDIRDAAGSAADLDAERQRLEAREAALAEREKRLEAREAAARLAGAPSQSVSPSGVRSRSLPQNLSPSG